MNHSLKNLLLFFNTNINLFIINKSYYKKEKISTIKNIKNKFIFNFSHLSLFNLLILKNIKLQEIINFKIKKEYIESKKALNLYYLRPLEIYDIEKYGQYFNLIVCGIKIFKKLNIKSDFIHCRKKIIHHIFDKQFLEEIEKINENFIINVPNSLTESYDSLVKYLF